MNKSQQPSSLPATPRDGMTWTEAWRRECEAREWVKRYRQKRSQAWWEQIKQDIRKVRGQAGLDTLIADMNKEWNATSSKN
jgi:hypothetical protein